MTEDGKPVSGQDRLVESLWTDARREADREQNRAKAEAERLAGESGRYRDREMSLASEKARDEARPHVSRILNRAHRRVRQLLLEGRYRFLESCFDGISNTISRDSGFRERARAVLPREFKEALSVVEGRDNLQIRLNPDDLDIAAAILKEEGLSPDLLADEGISGGVMITAGNGSIMVDGTIEGKLKTLRETPPVDLMKLLVIGDDV